MLTLFRRCYRPVLRRALHSIASRLTHRLREERFDGFFQVGALAFRAVHLLRLVLLDGQHFVKFVMTLAANVFVKRHRSVQLGVENPVRFFRESSLTNLAKSSPALPVPCRRCTVICAAEHRGLIQQAQSMCCKFVVETKAWADDCKFSSS